MGAPGRAAAPPAGQVGGEAAGWAYVSVSGIGRRGLRVRKLSLRFVRNGCRELPAGAAWLRGCGRAGSRRQAGAAEVDYQLCGGERPGRGH